MKKIFLIKAYNSDSKGLNEELPKILNKTMNTIMLEYVMNNTEFNKTEHKSSWNMRGSSPSVMEIFVNMIESPMKIKLQFF